MTNLHDPSYDIPEPEEHGDWLTIFAVLLALAAMAVYVLRATGGF